MKINHQPKRIILAVDLKAEDPTLTKRVWAQLKPLLKNENTLVEPVTILNRDDAAVGSLLKNRIGSLRAATERHLGARLKEMGLENLAPPRVLFADGSSTQRAVMALLDYAKKIECNLIAVSSHSRHGFDRIFLESFAETLSLQSPVPLFVVRANQKVISGKLKKILFPTDFSVKSKEALNIVCKSFSETKPKITLFHSYSLPFQNYMEPFISYPLPQSAIEEDYKNIARLGKDWAQELKKRGFACEVILDRKSSFVTAGILAALKKSKAELVALVSSTGKWRAKLLASTTRQVLRSSPRPVWVVHPENRKEGEKAVKLRQNSQRGMPLVATFASHR